MYIRTYETPEDSEHQRYLENTICCEELETVKKTMWNIPGGTLKEDALKAILDADFDLISCREYRTPKGEQPKGRIVSIVELDNYDVVSIEDDSYGYCYILKDGKKVGIISFTGTPSKLAMFSTRVPK